MDWKDCCDTDALAKIRNRNESRVRELLPEILAEYSECPPSQKDAEDIYACALNKLPARYVQPGGKVWHDPVSDEQIKDAVRGAVITILINPRLSS